LPWGVGLGEGAATPSAVEIRLDDADDLRGRSTDDVAEDDVAEWYIVIDAHGG